MEESKRIYRSLVRFRITGDPDDRPAVVTPSYFMDFIPAECFGDYVDVGAYDGDTLRTYLSLHRRELRAYHAFEPVEAQYARLPETARGEPRVHVYKKGVSDFDGEAEMSEDGTNSRLNAKGAKIAVCRLDTALAGKRIGCIKMDIEGAKPEALRGAEHGIRTQRPALAISVYHAREHLWSIPRWIRDLDLGYRLYLRHHLRSPLDTVCYAVPGT